MHCAFLRANCLQITQIGSSGDLRGGQMKIQVREQIASFIERILPLVHHEKVSIATPSRIRSNI